MFKAFETTGLKNLGSEDHLDLLNSVDELRSQGINYYVSLPQIIVCGDQSSGKSATLEAISGVSFPVKSNLSTRFPTELILRKTPQTGVKVSIVPHQDRTENERLSLGAFNAQLDDFSELPTLIEKAKDAMGITLHGKAFSKDLLRVEVSGPDRPHLTIVDLPGLIHSSTKQQSEADLQLVQEVVKSYMKEPRSVILAVISAKNDYANQIVLKLARMADPTGKRTMGVITKPDTLINGSGSEASYIALARNQDIEFRLGWHILKNMDSDEGLSTLEERDRQEENFFSEGAWTSLPRSCVGVRSIRQRLSKVLLRQIAAELPSLIVEIGGKINSCNDRLRKLGTPRSTIDEQRNYLVIASQSYNTLVNAAVDGIYSDSFFGNAFSNAGYSKRLRAIVQNLNEDFALEMTNRGHLRQITSSSFEKTADDDNTVIMITREKYIEHVTELMQKTRGRELPGTFNPMIVADLFLEQAQPWQDITVKHIDKVWKAAKELLALLAAHISDTSTSRMLFSKVFEPALEELKRALHSKAIELLEPYQERHPITYNKRFEEALQAVFKERREAELTTLFKQYCGSSLRTNCLQNDRTMKELLSEVIQMKVETKQNAASRALECMQAYYKVALERFIDDGAIQAIEMVLIISLNKIFSPISVYAMPPELVMQIAGESEENRVEREQLSKQLEILNKGSKTCKQFVGDKGLEADDGYDESFESADDSLDIDLASQFSEISDHWADKPKDAGEERLEEAASAGKEVAEPLSSSILEPDSVKVSSKQDRTKKNKKKSVLTSESQ